MKFMDIGILKRIIASKYANSHASAIEALP